MRIAFYGAFSSPTGLTFASRSYLHALHAVGVDLTVINLEFGKPSHDPLANRLMKRNFRVDFHLVNFPPIAAIPLTLFADRVVLLTVWETNVLPGWWRGVCAGLRDVWVPSEYNVKVFEPQLQRKVFRLPHALPPWFDQEPPADYSRIAKIADSDFVFYSIFVWQERKNPEGLIESFLRAFSAEDRAVLVIKVINPVSRLMLPGSPSERQSDRNAVLRRLRERTRSSARIELIDEIWSEEQVNALEMRGDCYISLHRSEGWGYPLFLAACRGKPVIATAYSAPLDYLDPETHLLVKYKEVPVGHSDAQNGYEPWMQWAEPEVEHAAQLMQEVYKSPHLRRDKAKREAVRLRDTYSAAAVGKHALSRLMI